MVKTFLRITALTVAVLLLSACNENTVLENLTQDQANQVLAILQQHDISAQKQGSLKGGYSVSVNPKESTAALSLINQYQLPWSAEVQIAQAFPEGALVSSPTAEQARVLSLQEQRFEQSLRLISQVVNARVHISYPVVANEQEDKQASMHVGILITYKGEIDENTFIPQIKNLIKNSLLKVRYEDISVALFPAPVVQYAPPTQTVESVSSTWIILFASLAIGLVITTAILFYRRKQLSDKSAEKAGEGV